MQLTKEEIQRALSISRAIQAHFDQSPAVDLRSTDLYPVLARQLLVPKDKDNGRHFRKILKKLVEANQLNLIPQCRAAARGNSEHDWIFNSASAKMPARVKVEGVTGNPMTLEFAQACKLAPDLHATLAARVAALPSQLKFGGAAYEAALRKKDARSNANWTKAEWDLLLEVCTNHTSDEAELSSLFQRSTTAISYALIELRNRSRA